jgi:hypothetical protein
MALLLSSSPIVQVKTIVRILVFWLKELGKALYQDVSAFQDSGKRTVV